MFPSNPCDIAAMSTEELEAGLCDGAARTTAAMYRWLLLVAEFDRRDAAGSWGCRSTATWQAWRCGLDARTARDHVRVARVLPSLPLIAEAFSSGEVPYSKVRALTRVATPATERELLDFARAATTAQLEDTIRGYHRAQRAGATPIPLASSVDAGWQDDGSGRVTADLAPTDAATVFAALDAGAERLHHQERESGSAEPVSPLAQRRARALVEMAGAYLGQHNVAADGDRFLVLVHAELDERTAALDNGMPIDAATLERFLCDQPVAALIKDSDGNPLFLGRRTRLVGRAMRRALKVRDGHTCAFPGCTSDRYLDGHHVRWWTRDLGPTDITNALLLCSFHHTLVHEGRVTITATGPGTFAFQRADGTTIEPVPPVMPVDDPAQPPAARTIAGGDGGRLDVGDAVIGLTSLLETSAGTTSAAAS
jgi:hypothetical protein